MDQYFRLAVLDAKAPKETVPHIVEQVASQIVDAAFQVHSKLGPGLLESVYEACLAHELSKRAMQVDRQLTLPIEYDGIRLETGLRLDLLIDDCVIVEVKTVDALAPVYHAQILTYLKLTGLRLGLLINFNVPLIKQGVRRIAL
jgi:GxxExxY protein